MITQLRPATRCTRQGREISIRAWRSTQDATGGLCVQMRSCDTMCRHPRFTATRRQSSNLWRRTGKTASVMYASTAKARRAVQLEIPGAPPTAVSTRCCVTGNGVVQRIWARSLPGTARRTPKMHICSGAHAVNHSDPAALRDVVDGCVGHDRALAWGLNQ